MYFKEDTIFFIKLLILAGWIEILKEKNGLNPGTAITPGQHKLLLSQLKGSLVACADTFRDKILLGGSQSRKHKGPPPSFYTTAESIHSAQLAY